MKRRKALALILTAILATATLAGCSSNQKEDTKPTTTSTTSSMLEGDGLVTPAEDEVMSSETTTNEDGSTTVTETMADGSVVTTTTAADGTVTRTETSSNGTQTVTTTPPSTLSTPTSNGNGSTVSTPSTVASTPSTSTPSTPATPSQSTSSSESEPTLTPDPDPTPEPTPEPDPEPVRERTIDPQYICDQVNARMGEVGVQNHIDYIMSMGYSYEEAKNDIYTMGWYTITRSLYENNNEWQINSSLEAIGNLNRPSAWMEVQCYLDASYNEVSDIDDAEYVRFIIYR